MNESELVKKILTRDRRALFSFYRKYSPEVLRFIQAKVTSREDAEEIFQDTLWSFLEALRDFEGKSSIRTFIFAIAGHKIIDFYRRKKIKHMVFSQAPFLEDLISPLITPEEALDARILKEKINSALNRILPQYRQALLSKYAESQSVAEIAGKLSVSVKSAESVLFRARKAFVKVFVSL